MWVVCQGISTGLLPDATYVLERLIVVDSSWCSFDTCESTPASAGAERQTCVCECAVHTLCSASDVTLAIVLLSIILIIVSVTLQIRGKATVSFQGSAVGCQQCKDKGKRVYTLPLVPGVYYTAYHHHK